MTLSKNYNRILQRTYPDCRMRWSDVREEWRLERKANYARTDINPENYPRDAVDTFIMRRDGYYLAGRYEPNRLPPVDLLVQILLANDTARMDVAGATAEEQAANWIADQESKERAKEAKLKEDNSFSKSGVGSELYDRLAWEEGRRVAVPNKYASSWGSGNPRGAVIPKVTDTSTGEDIQHGKDSPEADAIKL